VDRRLQRRRQEHAADDELQRPERVPAIGVSHPTLTTQASPAASIPASLTDTATLSGASSSPIPATGTITFHLYSNSTCTTQIATRTATVNGPGFYTSAPPVVVSTAGTYYWRDEYSGDVNNAPVPLTPCGAAGESTVVNAGGQLELCKDGANGAAGATFKFSGTNLTNGATFGPVTVTGGTCTAAFDVPAGRWQIFEDLSSGLWQMVGVDVVPFANYIGQLNSAGWVKVKVIANAPETQVTFKNQPAPATLKVCKFSSSPAIQGSQFNFTVGTSTLTATAGTSKATAGCSFTKTYQPGTNVTVKENVPANEQVAGISVSPNTTLTSKAGGTANITVGPGANIIYYDNEPVGPAQNGFVEVCKDLFQSDPFISRTTAVNFTVTDRTGTVTNIGVLPTQCSGPIQVAAGNVDIVETVPDGQQVGSISTVPAGALGPFNRANGTATVVVPVSQTSTGEVQVHFANQTITSTLKVCKVLTATSGGLANKGFTFSVADQFGTQPVTVRATTDPSGACVIVPGNFPLGDVVTVTEQATPSVGAEGGQPNTSASKQVTIGSGINSIVFTNQAFGQLEICKDLDPGSQAYAGTKFVFTITGNGVNTSQTIAAGVCGTPLVVPVGQYTVSEDLSKTPGFAVASITATGNDGDRTVSKTATSITFNVPLFTAPVPTGGETSVTFTNSAQTAVVKICKQIDPGSTSTAIAQQPYSFTVYDFTGGVQGAVLGSGGVTPPYPPDPNASASCVVTGPYPVVGTNGKPTKLQVTEDNNDGAHGFTGVVTDVNGNAIWNNPPSPTPRKVANITLTGPGTVVVTFVNSATAAR